MIMIILFSGGAVALLAAANGANDLSRGAAALLAGGGRSWRTTQVWCLGWTFAGSLGSGLLAAGVAHRFSARLESVAHHDPVGIMVVAIAAFAWVRVCTVRRLPVSTTHAILGGMLGVLLWTPGESPPGWPTIAHDFLLPLVSSPLIAAAFVMVQKGATRRFRIDTSGSAAQWVAAGLVGMSRGINDSAKIWALLLPLLPLLAGSQSPAILLLVLGFVAVLMLLGGIIDGRRVTELLAFRVTRLTPLDGLIVNVSTAGIIMIASVLGFPVASSHVVGGAVMGVGLADPNRSINWRIMAEIAFGWVLTLPGAAVLAVILEQARTTVGPGMELPLLLTVMMLITVTTLPGRRRHIAGLVTPQAVRERRVVFVCSGNTSRSPMAAAICNAEISRRLGLGSGIVATSAGLTVKPGAPMSTNALAALAEIGVPALSHAATLLDHALVDSADVIFCMTQLQWQQIADRFPHAAAKVFRLRADGDVDDPANSGPESFRTLASTLVELVAARVTGLAAPALA